MTLSHLPKITVLTSMLLALPMVACGDKDDTGPEGDTDTDTDADTDTDTDADADSDTDTDATATFSGTVLYADGSPAEGEVQLCATFCTIGATDADGNFLFSNLPADRWGLHVELGEHIAEGLIMYDVAADADAVAASPHYAVEWQQETELEEGDTGTIHVGGNLMLAVDTGAMALPLGISDYVIKGAYVQPELWPDLGTLEGEVVGLWYLAPFNATFDPPAAFSVQNDLGLDAGTVLEIMSTDYLGHDWVSGGTATVQDDGSIVADSGSGVLSTTTVALVR